MIDKTIKISKFLSSVLRHNPEKIGITLDKSGWTNVIDLLAKSHNLDMETLEEVVDRNNKKRFEFNEDKTMIRARQGHSVKVDLGYQSKEPPEFLYHGTATRFLDSIEKSGLQKMNRHAVHLSKDYETAATVGKRHGKLVIFKVKSGEMYKAGKQFYVTDNDVWLTDNVDYKYLNPILATKKNSIQYEQGYYQAIADAAKAMNDLTDLNGWIEGCDAANIILQLTPGKQ